MFTDEIRGVIADVLAVNGLSTAKTVELIKARVNGASTEELIVAAVAVLREQTSRHIARLEAENGQLTEDNERFGEQVEELEAQLEALRAKPAPGIERAGRV